MYSIQTIKTTVLYSCQHFAAVISKMEPPTNSTPLCVLCLVVALVAAARSQAEAPPDSDKKPHFLYMKRLREHLSDSNLVLPDSNDKSSSVEGKLVATSLETLSSTGRGMQKVMIH